MSDPYTPDETELRDCYAASLHEHAGEDYATAKADAERGIAKVKAKARAEAFNDARHTMQLSLDAAINPLRAEAWDEGYKAGGFDANAFEAVVEGYVDFDEYGDTRNPHREQEADDER